MNELNNIPNPHAPHKKYGEVNTLCRRLVENGKALYLNVEPIDGAEVNECFPNVELAISCNGGSVQYGWQIWEGLPGLLLEAEFHAVWVDTNGKYHDVTPKALLGIKKILFLPDPTRKYEGKQIMNEFAALKNDELLVGYVGNRRRYFEVINRGELATHHGKLPGSLEVNTLNSEAAHLLLAIARKYYS
jgi:hypothetical protein